MYFPHLKQFSDHFNGCMCVSYVMHITATKKKRKRKKKVHLSGRDRDQHGDVLKERIVRQPTAGLP